MNTTTGTWTKWDNMWMVRLPEGVVPPVENDEWHHEVVVVKRDGTESTVSVCRTAEFARDGIEIHALSKDGRSAYKHQQAIRKADADAGIVTVNGVTYAA